VARWFEQQQCIAAIVRPDHYVWGVAKDATELDQQLKTLEGDMK
jgi:3-(3-hydroxy-phenyl)propionate hydroxylase